MWCQCGWARVVKHIGISVYSTEGLFKEFDDTWGVGNVLCRRDRLHESRNCNLGRWLCSGILVGIGVVLGGALVSWFVSILYVALWHACGASLPP